MKRQAGQEGDVRFYYTGMAQASLLDRLSPGWKELGMNDGVWLEDLLRSAVEQARYARIKLKKLPSVLVRDKRAVHDFPHWF
ncbi:MAG: hypothetical protein JSW55_18005 [Chloroflexota bacterium]|nr:MAG: hypothetical protein JSW55_18005 [Chloroflexota bacterium]